MDDDATRPGPADAPAPFRVLVVPGITPGTWLRIWQERLPGVPVQLVHATVPEQVEALSTRRADVGLVRLPIDDDRFSAIPLYTETSVVVVSRDHVLAAADEVTPADLTGEVLLTPDDDVLAWADAPGERLSVRGPSTTAEAVELVAAGAGVLVVPQSLARLHHRHDVTYRPMAGAPTSTVALAWPADRTTDLVEAFIGIVRGRTVNSTRGPAGAAEPVPEPRRLGRPDRGTTTPRSAGLGGRSPSRRPRGGSTGRRRAP